MKASKNLVTAIAVVAVVLSGCYEKEPSEIVDSRAPAGEKARLLRELDRKFENPDAHYQLGKVYLDEGMLHQAEEEFNFALSFDPVHRLSQAGKVKVLLMKGEKERAALLADEYLRQTSVSGLASLNLGSAFEELGLDDYALRGYQQALNLAPNSSKVHREIGYYYLAKGDKDRAREYLSKSFHLNSNQPDVAGDLGRLGVQVQLIDETELEEQKDQKLK